jgi:hypothetical protein
MENVINIHIFKKNNRKSNNKIDTKHIMRDKKEVEERNKKYLNDKKSDFGNKSGFYRLPQKKQKTIMSIIDVLENEK